jgi:hypothetical protein
MLKLQVFVSHLHREAKFADLLRKRLTQDFKGQLELFISSDATSVPAGSEWFERVLAGMNRAQLQFVICSHQSVRRPWINYESGACRIRGVHVIPLCHTGITPEQLPVPLSMSEGVLLTDPKGLRRVYARIAEMLDEAVPAVDFARLGDQFKSLADEYSRQLRFAAAARRRASDESLVENPRVVCVTSNQFLKLGYENQLEMILQSFPTDLKHHVITDSTTFERVLQKHQVAIVHIAAYVCPRSGVLYFNDVDLPLGANRGTDLDFIRPTTLGLLLKNAGTRLVVIVSGDSLALATDLLSVTNVIVPRDIVSAKGMAKWVRTFYRTLRTKTLAAACAKAAEDSQARMQLLTQQSGYPDLRFPGGGRKAAGSRPPSRA